MAFLKNGPNFSRDMSRAARRLKSHLMQRIGNKRRRLNSDTRSRSSRGAEYGNITFQNDEHRLYRRKRAPRRVRRAARRQFKRFNYMLDKCQGLQTVIIPRTATMTNTPTTGSDAQAYRGITLYGFGDNGSTPGTNTNWDNGDMRFIFTGWNNVAPATTLATTKLRFRSAVMNLNIKNTATTDAAYRDGLCYVDLYHVLARKSGSQVTATNGSPAELWNEMLGVQSNIVPLTAVTTAGADGVTPFDAPGFCENFIVKSTRRVRLSIGQTFSSQLRDPGNYIIEEQDVLVKRYGQNLTEGFIIVAYNPSADPTTGVRGSISLEINTVKTYHFAATQDVSDRVSRSNLI